jgi:hypothetical protein
MKLLYRTAEWHGFAKLRMHTISTLEHLDVLTREFGHLMRHFRDQTCPAFNTKELPREQAARNRQQLRTQARVSPMEHRPRPTSDMPTGSNEMSSGLSTRKAKTLNIFTPKFHSLGDYVQTIQMFGCTDSYSTQLV